jgi:uncharacterized protein (DUF433 family)
MTFQKHPRISIDPKVCHGQPLIAGARIIVSQLLAALAAGETRERLLEDYPSLSADDVKAALAFASDLSKFEAVSTVETTS